MIISDEQLEPLIKENGLISDDALLDAKSLAQREKLSLYEAILRMDLLSDRNLGELVANFFNLPFVSLLDATISKEILTTIPEVVARKQRIISFSKDTAGLHVAMADPSDVEIINFLKKKTGLPIIVHAATEGDVQNAIALYSENLGDVFEKIIQENVGRVTGEKNGQAEDLPIIKIVDTIISYAYQNKASDIHIEPQNEASITRFRIDGILHDVATLPREIHPQIVSRVKILSQLRIDEHQSAQDGKFQFETSREKLDMRVSIMPITNGEKVVMRLLSERSRPFSLESLGFSTDNLSKVKDAYAKPYGMILATGPTGSGKTTTIYAILKILNKRGVNISTIEDPVEYEIEGVNQIQVNAKTNLTFSLGLRSILRQDPDIILVGEIRDEETAGIATGAAMTGHLVLSTIHANDAASAIPRLIDMGVEPFLLASTVNVIIAQRLVRKIHDACRVSQELPVADIKALVDPAVFARVFGAKEEADISVYKGKGCKIDYGTGYEGRIGIFEMLVINDEIREAIMARKDAETVRKIAITTGMKTMMEDGLEKVAMGYTTIEELLRVIKE
jgi:type IV pilus assembly protein PilB